VLTVRAGGGFEDFQQRRTVVPAQGLAAVDDHVAVEGGHRQEADVVDADLGGEFEVIGLDLLVGFLRVVDEIHLVDGDDQVRNADQRSQFRVTPGLRQHALARIDQDDREVCRGSGGDHVARVLLVARGVGDDVLARAGREVAVGDVDGDALFALGLQAVGEQRQVDGGHAALLRGLFDGGQGVGEDGLGVVQQAADQRALAVVDAAAGQEAQQAVVGNVVGGECVHGGMGREKGEGRRVGRGGGAGGGFYPSPFSLPPSLRSSLPSCAVPSRRRWSDRPGGWRRAR
jgi:hypothetical protein